MDQDTKKRSLAPVAVFVVVVVVALGTILILRNNDSNGSVMSSNDAKPSVESPEPVQEKPRTVIEILITNDEFSTMVKLLINAGLIDKLSVDGPYTIFAPTNNAFSKLPEGTLETLLEDKEELMSVLDRHIIEGKLMYADIDAENTVGDARIILFDIEAGNGVIHVVDEVL